MSNSCQKKSFFTKEINDKNLNCDEKAIQIQKDIFNLKKISNEEFKSIFEETYLEKSIKKIKNENENNFTFEFDETLNDFDNFNLDFLVHNSNFYGLPNETKNILKEQRGISDLYEWQKDLLDLLIKNNRNTVYCVPTSGGKTLVAELLILREVLLNKKNALFVFPYVSIVQEKIRALLPFSLKFKFIIEEYANDKGSIPVKKRNQNNCVYIATIEKAHLLLSCLLEVKRLKEIGLIIVDELHMLGDGSNRGCILESFLLMSILAKKRKIFDARILAMSATLDNFQDLSKFLDAHIWERKFRPVELKEYIKLNDEILQFVGKDSDQLFEKVRTIKKKPDSIDSDNLLSLIEDVIPNSSVLVFCPTKKQCENVVILLTKLLPKSTLNFKSEEKKKCLAKIYSNNNNSVCSVLKTGIPFGVAYHHSGLTNDEREIIENAFLKGVLSCIVCTSTLAAGVNLPAQRVIIRAPYVGRVFISSSQYKQMSGRAGRAGFCNESGESILMIKKEDVCKLKPLFLNENNECHSSMIKQSDYGVCNLILTLFSFNFAKNMKQVKQILSEDSLFGIQYNKDEGFLSILSSCFDKLFELNLINVIEDTDETIKITRFGKSCVKSLINIHKCKRLYQDLVSAQKALNVNSHFHLFFICTFVFDEEELPSLPDSEFLYSSHFQLKNDIKQAANLIGISNYDITKYLTMGQPSEKIKRYYITLIVFIAWKENLSLFELSERCKIQRGTLQNFLNRFASNSNALLRFVEELNEFWGLQKLLSTICSNVTLCSNPEIIPFLQLPYVRNARAKELFNGGFKSLEDIAKTTPALLRSKVKNLSFQKAYEIIQFIRQYFADQADVLQSERQYFIELSKELD